MSGRNEKGSTARDEFAGAICALKRALPQTYLLARAGWSSRFSPPSATSLHSPVRRGRWAWGRPATSLPCRRNACRYRGRQNAGLHALGLRGHAHLTPCRIYRRNRACRKLRPPAPAPTPGALDKAVAAAYGFSTVRPAGPAAAPARAPERG